MPTPSLFPELTKGNVQAAVPGTRIVGTLTVTPGASRATLSPRQNRITVTVRPPSVVVGG